jgi:hypothetical protein
MEMATDGSKQCLGMAARIVLISGNRLSSSGSLLYLESAKKTEQRVKTFRGRKSLHETSRTTDIEPTAPPLLVTVVVVAIVKWTKASNSMDEESWEYELRTLPEREQPS